MPPGWDVYETALLLAHTYDTYMFAEGDLPDTARLCAQYQGIS